MVFKKINKIDKSLARLGRKEKTQINKMKLNNKEMKEETLQQMP